MSDKWLEWLFLFIPLPCFYFFTVMFDVKGKRGSEFWQGSGGCLALALIMQSLLMLASHEVINIFKHAAKMN